MSTLEPTPPPPALPGYAVVRLVGRGATSTVWVCVDEQSGTEVAVKVPDLTASRVGDVLHQAARETAVLQGVRCEHVVRLHRTVHTPGGGVALVLDLADGGSLADLVAARGRLTDAEAATVFTALATALASVHGSGVVHGDLAPGNVLFTRAGKPMVADFASARLVGEADPPLVEGTAGFVAPEVARGELPTEASDAYGLGALAWFALTGKARGGEHAPDLAEAVGFLGARMGPVVAPLLADDPDERPGLLSAAGGFFGAATPVPVTLVEGPPDAASALTRRIRAQARECAAAGGAAAGRPERGERGGRHAASRPGSRATSRRAGRHSLVRRLGERGRGWWGAAVAGRRPRRWPGGSRALAALLVAMVALFGVGRLVGQRLHDGAADAPAAAGAVAPLAAATQSVPASGTPVATAPGADEATSPASGESAQPTPAQSTLARQVRADPAGVLAAVAAARASALSAADATALGQADAPDSPMLRSDTALVATLTASQCTYAELSFQVRSAEWVSGDDAKALVRAVVDRSAYRVVGPGRSQDVGAAPGSSYTYELAVVDAGWRLVTIT